MASNDQKLRVKLRKLIRERKAVEADIKTLEEKKANLGGKIMEALDELGETKFRPSKDEPGYYMQKPQTLVFNEDKLREYLTEHAKGIVKDVFKKVTKFDKDALTKAIDRGEVPGADKILADEEYVVIKDQKPRLMPMQE